MVAIVSGGTGLNLGSREVLGRAGMSGNPAEGRNGQGVYVNVGNGGLVLQTQDDLLAARGQDLATVRTYNSAATYNDDNGDGWSSNLTQLWLAGAVNTVGSTLQRGDADGSIGVYSFDAVRGLYVSTDGGGAYDTITYLAAEAQFEWRDGSTGATQRFEGAGARRLLASSDPSGNTLSYAYGTNGFLKAITTAGGDGTFYDYTGNNLTQVRTVTGLVTTTRVRYGYDLSNRLTSVTVDLTPSDNSIADGKTYLTEYTYDGTSNRVASITQSDGSQLSFTYALVGSTFRVATVRDGLGQASSFTYGTGFTTVKDAQGLSTRYDFDVTGRLTKITPPAGGATQFAYNANGDVISTTDGAGRVVSFEFDANGNQVLQRDALGNTVARTFDARNQLLTETVYLQPDPDGAGLAQPGAPQTTRYVYDATGRNLLRFSVSAEGRVTEHRYDAFGQQVASITYTAGSYATGALAASSPLMESDLTAWVATQNLVATQRVDFAWDGRGQLQSRTSYTTVSAAGDGVADGTQSVERFVYDQAGLLLQTVSGTGSTSNSTYDGLGRVLSASDAAGQLTLTQYDDANGKVNITPANGLVRSSAYDKAGRLVAVSESNAAGAVLGQTRYFYDASNRLRMTQDPTGVRSWILYDDAGRKTADIDGNGTMTEYAYNAAGQEVLAIRRGQAVNTALLVDATGLPVLTGTLASVRPLDNAADQSVWREYDAAGRLVRTAEQLGGSPARASVTEMRYDGASRVVEVVRYANTIPVDGTLGSPAPGAVPVPAASAQDRSARSFYDADGRLVGTLDAEGFLTVYRYTGAGQLAERIRYASATEPTLRATGTLAQLMPAASSGDIREVRLYDGKGQLIAEIDGESYLTETVYDANGNVTRSIRYANAVNAAVSVTSSVGAIRPAPSSADQVTVRTYDALDRVVQETTPQAVVTQYAYDALGNLVSTTKAAGSTEVRTLLARYDLQNRLVAELSAEGAALLTGGQTQAQVDAIWTQYGTSYGYDAAGRRISSVDAVGARTLFFYNADGALTHTVNALGEVRETRYDVRGRATETIAYANRISTTGLVGGLVTDVFTATIAAAANTLLDGRTTYTYTRDGNVASLTDAAGAITTLSYNAFGEQIGSQLAGVAVNSAETYSIDRRGLRTATTQDAGGLNVTTSTQYDAFGRAIRSVDGNGNVREQVFDRLGRVVTTRDPLNATRSTSYDAFGRSLTETDALGNVTRYSYDTAARTVTMTTPEGIVSTTVSTRHGQVQSFTDGKQQVTSYGYDRNGKLLQTAGPLTTTSSKFDAIGRLIETTDANGNKIAYSYDAAGRVLTRRVDPAGLNLTTSYAYDGKGQQISVTDPNGVVTTISYDRKGQVLKRTQDASGLNLQTTYTYDARGNTLSVTSAGGMVTQYDYDALGRRIRERVDPAGLNLQRSWAYDRNDNVVSATDARGNVTRYAYDADDHLVFTLDPLGNLRQDSYDAAGRVTRTVAYATPISTTGLGATLTAAAIQPLVISQAARDVVEHRVYDKDNRLAATVDGTGAVVKYSYDADGNVVARTAFVNRIALASWVVGSMPAPVAATGRDAVMRTVYDALNRAIYTMDATGAVVAQAFDGNGNVLQRTAYALQIPTTTALTQSAIAAAVTLVANPARDATLRNSYDAAGRLVWSVDGMGAVTQRSYDKNGNVVRQVAYATAILAGASPSSVAASSLDRIASMAYDSANRLVFQVDALGGVTEQGFDADGHVIRRTAYANKIGSVPTLGTAGTAGAIRSLLVADATNDRTQRYGYDVAGRQALAIDAVGAATETQYDAAGNTIATIGYANAVNVAGLASNATLAAMKALMSANAAADRVERMAYDAAGQVVYAVRNVSDVDNPGIRAAVTFRQYDGAGRLTRTTRYGNTIAASTPNMAADFAAAVALVVNATLDQVDVLDYNAAGQLISAKDALGALETYTYDALGNRLTFVNKKGSTWTYTYDAAGRMLTETSPQVMLASTKVDSLTGSIAVTAPANAAVVTRLAYDALGNLTQRTEAAGRPEERTTRYEYDALGRQVRVIHPPVGVYQRESDAALAANGATGVASRVEAVQELSTQTFYDALGNAVASRDVGGAISQKTYDLLGRVVHEVDAMGFITAYARNIFGEVTTLTRYGAATTLASGSVTQASQAVTRAQVDATINAVGFDRANARTLSSAYDRAGRVVETTEAAAFVYDSSAAAGVQTTTAGKTTRNTYDAFGQLVQVATLRNALTGTWATTSHYFDAAGRETATVDALGYVTTRKFDANGNLTALREYANAVAPGSWTTTTYALPTASTDDRITTYAYDRLNRKVTESRASVEFSTSANGTSTRGTLSTTYGYDALGNQIRVTDPDGKSTYTFYDALGRITAVAEPSRSSTPLATALMPLTAFQRDAYGNVLVKIEYVNGATAAGAQTPVAPSTEDRTTLAVYDSFGRATQTTDANGANAFSSYDAFGHVAKKWQGVTGNDGITRTLFEVNAYDKLGQLVESRSPASTSVYVDGVGLSTVSQSQAGVVVASVEYNAFGEVTRKGTQGQRQEYFEYDNAGRLWRTNSGDGVDRIMLYDLQGNTTAEIRSSGSGRDNFDIKGFASAQAADANPNTRRIDTKYDLLGRVTAKVEAARQDLQGGVAVQRQFTTAVVNHSASYYWQPTLTAGAADTNKVTLTWNSLAALGSGDVKVSLEYRTPQTVDTSTLIPTIRGGIARTYNSGIFDGDDAASGATLSWFEYEGDPVNQGTDIGVGMITRIVVYKKDVDGNWQVAIDQAPGYGVNELQIAAPADPTTSLKLEIRGTNAIGDTGWWTAGLIDFGDAYRFDARGMPAWSYEYRVTLIPASEPARVTGTGVFWLAQPYLNSITTPISFGLGGASVLGWTAPDLSVKQEFRYRPSGSGAAWSTLPVGLLFSTYNQVNASGLGAGTYEFELLWTRYGAGVPTDHATGSFTIVAEKPAYWVPPVNLPPITGLTVGSDIYGHPTLTWDGASATSVQYRVSGGTWTSLTIGNKYLFADASGSYGQQAVLTGIPAGTYEVRVLAGSPPTAQATGNLVIYPQNPGYYQTVYVQVPTYVPVIAYYAPVYETRYGTRTVSYQVWVNDTPYISGYDEYGWPIWVYPGHYETRYYTETYSYQVQVGTTPVYATDENGNIVYQTVWVTQAQQQWVEGTTPTPTLTVTTPPYQAGYWVAAVPAQYYVSVTTAPGSAEVSSNVEGTAIGQTAGLNGDARWLRPTVLQKTDRWGNVIEVTDPRNVYWKTTYRYNANNQLVQQTQPDLAGNISASSPVTSIYYDKLGRQVAVKDANGNINGQVFDAGGNLEQELHADGGIVKHSYNAFGERVQTVDAMGNVIGFTYDKMGHLLSTARGKAALYQVNALLQAVYQGDLALTDSWSYDQLGRKLTQSNGNGEVLKYAYDLRGNLVQTTQPLLQVTRAAFDAQGNKIAEVDANGSTSKWTYSYFGQVLQHVDLGGGRYGYAYDNAGQLTAQTLTRGVTTTSITYGYDAAGQVTTIRDSATGKVTTYMYDLSGRKIREQTAQGGKVYQDNHLAYDAQGRLRDVSDASVHVVMAYDKVGNRTQVTTSVNYQAAPGPYSAYYTPPPTEVSYNSNKYFRYDAMNRQVVVDGVDAAGNLGTQGHSITYDKNGNRTSDTYWGNKAVPTSVNFLFYDQNGSAVYSDPLVVYTEGTGYTTETYQYDKLNRLQSVMKDGTQIDLRFYDGADRVVQSGPINLPVHYAEIINRDLAPDQMNGKELRINRYDANGRLLHQKVKKSDGVTDKADISWDANETLSDGGTVLRSDGYDAAGNARSYVVQSHEGGGVTKFTTTLAAYEGYEATVTSGVSSKLNPGSSTQEYDANGFLVRVTDSTQAKNNRVFVNDAAGRTLFVNQADGNIQRQLIVNGEVLGTYGVGVDPVKSTTSNPTFTSINDFNFGYAKITAGYPNASPGAYTVRTGDTLQSIAQSAYGDSALWYRIAEANGLASSNDLKVGQTLNIPNRVSTINNNGTTFKPYDPSRIQGDMTPNLPVPHKDCGGIGQVLMVVVAVAVAVSIGGPLGAALGSIASQIVGLATGTIDDFDWKSVALAAVSAGVNQYIVPEVLPGFQAGIENTIVRAALSNAVTQGIGVATGLQQKFDWRGVAASAVGAGVGEKIGESLGLRIDGKIPAGMNTGEFIAKTALKSLTAGLAAAAARGGRIVVQQVAVDAFGNALGQSLAESANRPGTSPAANVRFPDRNQAFIEGRAAALPELADVEALNRSLLTGPQPAQVDPEDVDLVAAAGKVSLYKSPRVAEPQAMHRASERQYRTDVEAVRAAYLERRSDPTESGAAWQRLGLDDPAVRAAYGTNPAPSAPRSAALPEIQHQRRYVGGATQAVAIGWGEAFNPTNSFGERLIFGGLAALSTPVAMIEGALYAPFNVTPAITETGQYVARAGLQTDATARNTDVLAAISTGAEAFSSFGAWLVGPRSQAAAQTSEDLARARTTYGSVADVPNAPVGWNNAGVRAYPDGSLRTPDGKFASAAGMPAPGTVNANNYAEFLRNNGVDVVGTELEVRGPLGPRKYDIATRNADGTLFGIEIKSGGAIKSLYQEFTDMYVNRFGAAGCGRIEGQRVTGSMTIYLPSGGH